MGASVGNLNCRSSNVELNSNQENLNLPKQGVCELNRSNELTEGVDCVNDKPPETPEDNNDSLNSESSWFNENVSVLSKRKTPSRLV